MKTHYWPVISAIILLVLIRFGESLIDGFLSRGITPPADILFISFWLFNLSIILAVGVAVVVVVLWLYFTFIQRQSPPFNLEKIYLIILCVGLLLVFTGILLWYVST